MAQPLEKRIASALRTSSRLADVETTIADVEGEIVAAEARLVAERARSIDPELSTPQAREARDAVADLEHDLRRLSASLELLRTRRQVILDDDSYAKRRERYNVAEAKRDALAEHIKIRYPALALELAELAESIIASDTECAAVNLDRPRGEPKLLSAEQLVRGYNANGCWNGSQFRDVAKRITEIELPLLASRGNIWPLRSGRARDAEAVAAREAAARHAREQATTDREASKQRYLASVTPGSMITYPSVIHADGMSAARGAPVDCWMYPEQVEINRRKGLTVEPWTEAKAVGAVNVAEVADAA